jgi:restriction system protein
MKLTGAAILVSRGMRVVQAAPAAYPYRSASQIEKGELMSSINTTSVAAAFEMLIEELEADIDFVNQQGSKAFEARDYDGARDALEKAAQITAYREKLDALRREWTQVIGTEESQDEETRSHRRDLGRVRRGLRTPEHEYVRPILQALTELGGSAPLGMSLSECDV